MVLSTVLSLLQGMLRARGKRKSERSHRPLIRRVCCQITLGFVTDVDYCKPCAKGLTTEEAFFTALLCFFIAFTLLRIKEWIKNKWIYLEWINFHIKKHSCTPEKRRNNCSWILSSATYVVRFGCRCCQIYIFKILPKLNFTSKVFLCIIIPSFSLL